MCYNKELSLFILIIGIASSIKLFNISNDNIDNEYKHLKYKLLGLTLLIVSLMQLVEWGIWSNLNPFTIGHQFWSLMIFFEILLQVITLNAVIINDNLNKHEILPQNSTLYYIIVICFGIFLLVSCYLLYKYILPRFGSYCSRPACLNKDVSCRLEWDVLNINTPLKYVFSLLYIFFILITGYILSPDDKPYLGTIFLLILLLLSIFINKYNGFSSFFCFITVIVCSIIIILNDKIY